jgi:type IV pilus assembly protein PilN
MYNLDINFLKDRGLDLESQTSAASDKPKVSLAANIPLIAGAIAAISLPAAAFGFVKVMESQKADLQQQIQGIDAQIASMSSKNQEVQKVKEQISAIEAEVTALATVFDRVKSMTAILQDISDRTPPGMQIGLIKQSSNAPADDKNKAKSAPAPVAPPTSNKIASTLTPNNNTKTPSTPAATPAASTPTPTEEIKTTLTIDGMARSYDDVNDFTVFLQKSKFFNPDKIKVTKAQLADYQIVWNTDIDKDKDAKNKNKQAKNKKDEDDRIQVPQGIEYSISAELSNTLASKLITELNSKAATGLVTRIQTLERKGAIAK